MYSLELNLREAVHFKYLSILITLFSATWLISVILAVKLVSFYGISLTGGFFIFPLTMLLNAIIVECYGYKNSRQAIWCGTFVNITYVMFINLVDVIPADPRWGLASEFSKILVPHTRIILASVLAFWVSGFINSFLMVKLKISETSLKSRIIVATTVSIFFDLLLYFLLGFYGNIDTSVLRNIFLFALCKKLLCEIALLPLTWSLINLFKKIEGIDITDNQTNLTPFSLDNVYDINKFRKTNYDSK